MKEWTMEDLECGQYLLERMLELAEAAAEGSCTDKRRAALQKGLALLREGVRERLDKSGEGDT